MVKTFKQAELRKKQLKKKMLKLTADLKKATTQFIEIDKLSRKLKSSKPPKKKIKK